jgi:cytochrome P450
MGPDNDLLAASMAELPPLAEWATRQSQRDRLAPDGIGAIIHQAADAGEITPAEAPLLVRALLSAGVDTTVNGLGAALSCLSAAPDQWARLHADPTLARNAFEEAIRFESPVQTFFRTTGCDVELAGAVAMPEGTKMLMFLAAANRDPRRFADPDRFDITRVAAVSCRFRGRDSHVRRADPGAGWKARRCWRRWRVGWGGWRRWGRRYGGTTMRCAG